MKLIAIVEMKVGDLELKPGDPFEVADDLGRPMITGGAARGWKPAPPPPAPEEPKKEPEAAQPARKRKVEK